MVTNSNFNPRSPCGERRSCRLSWRCPPVFQSTLPVWGATLHAAIALPKVSISIHAPRVGSDDSERGNAADTSISIHAPRVGSDCVQC